MKNVGIALIIIGIAATLFTGFTLITRKKVVDLGKLEISKEERTPVYWKPIAGIAILVAGVVVTLMSKRSKI